MSTIRFGELPKWAQDAIKKADRNSVLGMITQSGQKGSLSIVFGKAWFDGNLVVDGTEILFDTTPVGSMTTIHYTKVPLWVLSFILNADTHGKSENTLGENTVKIIERNAFFNDALVVFDI